jgi:predicted NBD/HSP70 family sugar kinase/biotin operon repressor
MYERRGLGVLRARNRHRVVEVLRRQGRVSQADIARATGLSRSTISTLVLELRTAGLVTEFEDGRKDAMPPRRSPPGGRPAVLLGLDDSAGTAVGIDFGHSHVRVGIANLSHQVTAERAREFQVDNDAAGALDAAAAMVDEVLADARVGRDRVIGVGMGIPGPIDRRTGTIGSASILPGWVGLAPAEEMARRLQLTVEIDNDANVGALAEVYWGAGRGCSEVTYIKASTGIGAGIVISGQLHRGAVGTAGEIGHTTVDEQGPLCRCGSRGCLETVAGGAAVVEQVRSTRSKDLTLARVLELAAAGDPACRRAIADAGRQIGVSMAAVCNILNPELIIVGGHLSEAGDMLLGPLRESLRRYAVRAAVESVAVVQGVLGERAEMLGALALVLQSTDRFLSERVMRASA